MKCINELKACAKCHQMAMLETNRAGARQLGTGNWNGEEKESYLGAHFVFLLRG